METQSKRVKYYEDEFSSLSYDMEDDGVILHSEITVWKPSVFKKCLRVLNTLFTELKSKQIYNVVAITPTPKFSKLFGARYLYTITHEGKEYEVVTWDLK